MGVLAADEAEEPVTRRLPESRISDPLFVLALLLPPFARTARAFGDLDWLVVVVVLSEVVTVLARIGANRTPLVLGPKLGASRAFRLTMISWLFETGAVVIDASEFDLGASGVLNTTCDWLLGLGLVCPLASGEVAAVVFEVTIVCTVGADDLDVARLTMAIAVGDWWWRTDLAPFVGGLASLSWPELPLPLAWKAALTAASATPFEQPAATRLCCMALVSLMVRTQTGFPLTAVRVRLATSGRSGVSSQSSFRFTCKQAREREIG